MYVCMYAVMVYGDVTTTRLIALGQRLGPFLLISFICFYL